MSGAGRTGARILAVSDKRVADGPYGILELRELGHDLVQAPAVRSRWRRKLRDVVEHRLHLPLEQAIASSVRTGGADVVLAFLEPYARLPAMMRARRLPPFRALPLAMIACWLADDLVRLPGDERRGLARRFRGVDLTMVFSENQVDVLVDSGFRPGSVEAVPFGIAPEQHPPADPARRSSRIAAVGFDRGRDYATLVDAVRGTDLEVDLYCGEGNIAGIDLPPNLRFRGIVPYDEYRHVIATAGVVAVPTRAMQYPSGQTVALEAAATGACIALSSTTALREYFSPSTAVLLPVGDPLAWREGLTRTVGDPARRAALGAAARDDVRRRFTCSRMWARVDQLFRERGWVPRS